MFPKNSAVTAASSATGISDVPPVATRIMPPVLGRGFLSTITVLASRLYFASGISFTIYSYFSSLTRVASIF